MMTPADWRQWRIDAERDPLTVRLVSVDETIALLDRLGQRTSRSELERALRAADVPEDSMATDEDLIRHQGRAEAVEIVRDMLQLDDWADCCGGTCRIPAAHPEVSLQDALAGVRTHNGAPITPKNLRWAARHEALCRSYIFDVLNALADALEADAE